ncbi:DUF3078 domain-containing protein [Autumnicola musiva]|uniref:DUF3078 domain-containing protein n=1 Tax=Autumnicola musiva TaxID=3075589 RepID=A0ABU3D4V8_9FLAO|nr:DUF3078 domain-containing protein [Zunongwangia sp. F117]MDT0676574.1 DUF3078 domain-containing protein [Zunongwangia sp. F117]
MKIRLIGLILCLISFNTHALEFPHFTRVVDTTEANDSIPVQDTTETNVTSYWNEENAVGLDFNEVAFVNWNSGGNNSVSALIHGNFKRNYKKALTKWNNSAVIRYGLNAQEGREIRKTEDELVLSSSFGYRRDSTSNWFYSAQLDFNTQFSNGYKYPDKTNPISKFMAPAYLFLGVGAEYSHPEEELTVYISPLTQKSTFVLDQRLANEGMFGVVGAVRDEEGNIIEEGEMVRMELGFLVNSNFEKEIFENVNLKNRLSLYSDYINNFGNVDVDWQLNVNLKVNDFIKASVGSHLRYDNDVKYKEDVNDDGDLETFGPRVQFKQTLGVGVVYEF